jgi:hypothetical protein
LAHKTNPAFAATKLLLEKTTKQTVKAQNKNGIMFLLTDRKINFGLLRTADFIQHLCYITITKIKKYDALGTFPNG